VHDSKSIKTVVSLLCIPYQKEMHSRDTTVLIDLVWFNVVHYSSLFQYFFQSTMVPTLVDFLVYSFVNLHYYNDYDWNTIQGWI